MTSAFSPNWLENSSGVGRIVLKEATMNLKFCLVPFRSERDSHYGAVIIAVSCQPGSFKFGRSFLRRRSSYSMLVLGNGKELDLLRCALRTCSRHCDCSVSLSRRFVSFLESERIVYSLAQAVNVLVWLGTLREKGAVSECSQR
jgi:hypothetical protein